MSIRPVEMGAALALALSVFCSTGTAVAADGAAAKDAAHRYDRIGIRPADLADAASTTWGLNQGLGEANPLIKPLTDIDAFAGSLLGKYLVKRAMVDLAGLRPAKVNLAVDAVGWGAACANVVTITGGEPVVSALAFGGCMVTAYRIHRDIYVADTGMLPNGHHVPAPQQQAAAARLGRSPATTPVSTSAAAPQSATPNSAAVIHVKAHYYDRENSRFHDARSGKTWIIKNPSDRGYSIEQLLAVVDKMEAGR